MMAVCSDARWIAVALILLGSALGCSDSNLGRVTGTVAIDGRPLANAMVTFKPLSGERPAAAKTDEQGRYELIYSRDANGAVLGEHVVEISTFIEIMEDDTTEITPETVPARYNVQSELSATVKRGANVFDFDLESGGEFIQPED